AGAAACAGAAGRSAPGFRADRGAERGAAGPARSAPAGSGAETVLLPALGRREGPWRAVPAARAQMRGVRGAARADGSRGGGADRRAAVTAGDSLTAARPWRRSPARRASGISHQLAADGGVVALPESGEILRHL